MTTTPLSRFKDLLKTLKEQMDRDMDEVIMGAEIISSRPMAFSMDEAGQFHCQASGDIDECIRALTAHLDKLQRIKNFKEGSR